MTCNITHKYLHNGQIAADFNSDTIIAEKISFVNIISADLQVLIKSAEKSAAEFHFRCMIKNSLHLGEQREYSANFRLTNECSANFRNYHKSAEGYL